MVSIVTGSGLSTDEGGIVIAMVSIVTGSGLSTDEGAAGHGVHF